MTVAAAYPFIEIAIKPPPPPLARRAAGVIAIVGTTAAGNNGGEAPVNTPRPVSNLEEAATLFANPANVDADGNMIPTTLYDSIRIAKLQEPGPSKIYGVRVDGTSYGAGLAGLEGADDVTFVSLANEVEVASLAALKAHVENMSSAGLRRIGVAMVSPAKEKSTDYVTELVGDKTTDPPTPGELDPLESGKSRMIMVAARGATANGNGAHPDVATAAMAAIAGYQPHISMVLKKLVGFRMPLVGQYSPSEIIGLSQGNVIPIIDPALITGESLHFAEGRCFTTDTSLLYIDIVRTLDDIEFRLKAGLIGSVGDARVTKAGLTRVKSTIEGILGQVKRRRVITRFTIDIPVLDILSIPEELRTPADNKEVTDARQNREVAIYIAVTYGPAVHRLKVTLEMKF